MTVNTLGTDSRLGGNPLSSGSSSSSRTVAEWLWPFCIGGLALFSISALFYYHFHRTEIEVTSLLQQLYAGLYDWVGLAPSVLFCLLVVSWSTIWLVTGVLERPLSRVARLVTMAMLLGIYLNLGDGGVIADVHKGHLGAWLAGRLVAGIGYLPSLVLVWPATLASLLLATDWFFSDMFDRSRVSGSSAGEPEIGVEANVTDHLRGLAETSPRAESAGTAAATAEPKPTSPPWLAAAAAPAAPPAEADASGDDENDADVASAGAAEPPAEESQDPEEQAAETASPEPEAPPSMSYAERRRRRQADRIVLRPREIEAEPEPSVAESKEARGSELISEAELASLFAEPNASAEPAAATAFEAEDTSEPGEDVEAQADELVDSEGEEDGDVETSVVAEDEVEVEDRAEQAEFETEEADDEEVDEEELDDESTDEDEDDDEAYEDEVVVEDSADDDEFEEDVDADEEEVGEEEGYEDEVDEEDVDEEEAVEADADEDEAEPQDVALEAPAEAEDAAAFEDVALEAEGERAAEDQDDEDVEPEADEAEFEVDEAADDEDADEAIEELEESTVAIPRPEHPVEPTLPRPPVQPAAIEASPSSKRQQKLFGGIDDQLLQEAEELIGSGRRVTVALLQRKLRIDYELAQELRSELESRGLLSSGDDA